MPNIEIAKFSVSYLQILDENGVLDEELAEKSAKNGLDREKLVEMYGWMRLARELDTRMLKLQRQGRLGTFPLNTGQEAISIPAALAMRDKDWFMGAFRELGGRLVRGEPIPSVLHYYNGFEEGNVLPDKELRISPTSVVIGCQIPQAAGLAYAAKLRGTDEVTVCFIGDGGTSEGDFHEGLNFASVWKAPVVYIVQNNQWAISVPREKQTASRTIAQKGLAYDMPCLQVDGNDPLAMHLAVSEAIDRASKGEGPTLIEAVTYRLLMHTTADDPTKYRTEEEEKEAWTREPMIRFAAYLRAKGYWDDAKEEALLAEVKQKIEAAIKEFESPVQFAEDAPFLHVYGTEHDGIREQHEEFLAEARKEAGTNG
ncbi:MAG: pyruvate dehydrogenase (acetyl-transferring) E1 component subunit alpha [Gemmatimonadales bacterium]|nr:pyruvate dehydrogenase (acetyl-transferring) E1 component subunit alpha [Gemmatimonadales bacterium]